MLPLKLALKYLLRKPITLFAVLSVLLGTTAFVVVVGVMDGYVKAFDERSRSILSDMVVQPWTGTYLPEADQLCNVIEEASPDVEECSVVVNAMGVLKVRSKDGSFGVKWVQLVGVDPAAEQKVSGLDVLAKAPATDDWIIPGRDLLAPRAPDNVTELTLVTAGTEPGGPPRKTPLQLVSTVEFGLHQYDVQFAYVSRSLATKLAGLESDGASAIRIRIRDVGRASEVRDKLQAALDNLFGGLRKFKVYRYQELSTMFRALESMKALAELILGCLFAAATFAVIAICHMIVLQKTRDIGILRSFGLSRPGIMRVFVAYGVLSCLAGLVLGFGLGVFILDHMDQVRHTLTVLWGQDVFPENLYGMKDIPHTVNPWELLTITALALGVSLLGSLYPAWRAARLNTVESLRYE